MRKRIATIVLGSLWVLCVAAAQAQQPATPASRPKVRTVTAFVRLDRESYRSQVADALKILRAAKGELTAAGYEVETIRITSQPFPDYIKGLSVEQALAFFHEYDKLAKEEGFTPDIGPAMSMSEDTDDPKQADLLARILASTESINGFITVAGENGIHWNAIRAAARVMKYLEEHTPRSEGNFRFAAGAFPPEVAPFFPVSYTSGDGHEFALGLESANVVQQVFSAGHLDFDAAVDHLATALGREAGKVEAIAKR